MRKNEKMTPQERQDILKSMMKGENSILARDIRDKYPKFTNYAIYRTIAELGWRTYYKEAIVTFWWIRNKKRRKINKKIFLLCIRRR